jgi:hypothetical protein
MSESVRKQMTERAAKLNAPGREALAEYRRIQDRLPAELNERILSRSDLESLIGSSDHELLKTNHRNHFRYMESVFVKYNPDDFVETLLWVFKTYAARGFTIRYWKVMLPEAQDLLRKHLPASAGMELLPFYDWIESELDELVDLSRNYVTIWEKTGEERHHGSDLRSE